MTTYTATPMPVFASTRSNIKMINETDKDNELCEFTLAADQSSFKCIPNRTSNFDVFVLANPHINKEKAHAIWEYYRNLFINAQFSNEKLSSFRATLQAFIRNKTLVERDPFDGSITRNGTSRYEEINRFIGLARWLELQFNIDTVIDELNENWSPEKLEIEAKRILGTVPYNNYVSYFSNNIHDKLKDPTDYDTRKLFVRNVYAYSHKQIRWYICASEFGAVKVWVHTKHSPFIAEFEKRINNGVTINVVTSKILRNIDSTTPYIKIENFFLDT